MRPWAEAMLRQLLGLGQDSEPYSMGWTSARRPENHRPVLMWLQTCNLPWLTSPPFFFESCYCFKLAYNKLTFTCVQDAHKL